MKFTITTEEPIYCKSCFEQIKLNPARRFLEKKPLLCDKCIFQIEKKLEYRDTFGIKTLFLSNYNGLMKEWLMHFKEYGDIELAPCFLSLFLPFIKLRFLNHIFVPLPSSPSRIKARGFSHLEEMLKASQLPFLTALTKRDGEQKNKGAVQRREKQGIALCVDPKVLEGKRVVLFDDVFTTGSTFRESLSVLKTVKAKCLKGLILMDNFRLNDLKIEN